MKTLGNTVTALLALVFTVAAGADAPPSDPAWEK